MSDANPTVLIKLNRLTDQRLHLEVEREAENQRFQAALATLTREHEEKLHGFDERERELDADIWQTITANRAHLIASGKRSFVTMVAKFQLRKVAARTEILDKHAIMEKARSLGIVRQIAEPPKGEWRFSARKFLAWLDKHGERRSDFEEFLSDIAEDESLTVQPNTNYTVEHNSQRISPPSVTVKKSSPRD